MGDGCSASRECSASASDSAAVSSRGAQPPNCWTQCWMMTAVWARKPLA
jgi:hypothetical protein